MNMSEPGLTPLVAEASGGLAHSCQAEVPTLSVPRDHLPHMFSFSTMSYYSKYTVDDEGLYHYHGRKRRKGYGSAKSNSTLVESFGSTHGLAVVLKPLDSSQFIAKMNPLKLH